jgi:hypothetical protein
MPITLGDTEITISGVGSNPVKVRQTRYGYSGTYNVLQLGEQSSGQSVSLFVDPLSNTGAAFSGNGTELIVPQNFAMIAPTASNTTFKDVIRFNDGPVTMPHTPAFHVWHSVGGSGFPSSSTATWDTVVTNNGSHFKTSAGTGQNQRFIAPVAGYYHFNVMMLSNSGTQLFYRIRKNGTDVPGTYVETYTAGSFQTATSTATISLAANDYVEVFVSTNAAYGNVYANFNGFLIG